MDGRGMNPICCVPSSNITGVSRSFSILISCLASIGVGLKSICRAVPSQHRGKYLAEKKQRTSHAPLISAGASSRVAMGLTSALPVPANSTLSNQSGPHAPFVDPALRARPPAALHFGRAGCAFHFITRLPDVVIARFVRRLRLCFETWPLPTPPAWRGPLMRKIARSRLSSSEPPSCCLPTGRFMRCSRRSRVWDSHVYNLAELLIARHGGLFGNPDWTLSPAGPFPVGVRRTALSISRPRWLGWRSPASPVLSESRLSSSGSKGASIGPSAAWWCILTLFSLPTLMYQASSTKNDLAVIFGVACWYYAYWHWRREPAREWIWWMAIALGFGLGKSAFPLPSCSAGSAPGGLRAARLLRAEFIGAAGSGPGLRKR